jgi:hypothetical protein
VATYPQHLPDRIQAEAYLQQAASSNPGPWVEHSHQVARSAALLAARHPDLEPQSGYILGLLHDIGRQAGVYGMRHVMDGYDFLVQEGFPDAARICLTHSYPIPNMMAGSSPWDGTPEQARFVANFLATHPYNIYDRLIQLCDSLCLPNGPVLMEKRLIDVVLRYGFNDHTLEKWQAFYHIKSEFEQVMGCSIYRLLPGVVENTFEVDLVETFVGK